ncbi:MAG: HNH endonuclease [Ruminococcus sp.]|nr:HNH endonuclease [Ruminococcus sp.]
MDSISVILIIFLIIIIGLIIAGSVYTNKKSKEYAIENSKRYAGLIRLNEKYHFYGVSSKNYLPTVYLNSKSQYDRFDLNKSNECVFDYYNQNKLFIIGVYDNAHRNEVLYRQYSQEFMLLPQPIEMDNIHGPFLNKNKVRDYESKLIEKNTKQTTTSPLFVVKKTYTSPQGRNNYTDEFTYNRDELYSVIRAINQRQRNVNTAKAERRKMSQDLRYRIMKRDNFRCVLCGRSAKDGVSLHVDHIKPISKGGKTIESNLRTLCSDCNLGKRDKYDESGLN